MDREDFKRIPTKPAWLNYVEGNDPTYPEKALAKAFSNIRTDVQKMNEDPTTPDTRLADYLLDSMPVTTDDLLNLTTGGYFANGRIWVLHSRFRYFDPEKRRAGLPEDVAALVDQLGNDTASVTLVNTNPVEPRTVTIQAGGYAEHQFNSVTANGKTTQINGRHLTLHLAPGTGTKLNFSMRRYQNAPTFHFPWNQ
jgi:hypothetical protein